MVSILFVSSFAISANEVVSGDADKFTLNPRQESLAVLSHAEGLIKWQSEVSDLYESMAAYSRQNKGEISARQLQRLRVLIKEYHQNFLPKLDKIVKSEPFLLGDRDVVKIVLHETRVEEFIRYRPLLEGRNSRSRRGSSTRLPTIKAKKYLINPNDEEGAKLWLHFKNQFAAKIVLLESYILGLSPFIETKAFRYVLLRDLSNDATSEDLEELWFESMENLFQRDRLVKALKVFERGVELEENKMPLEQMTKKIVTHSRSFKELKRRQNDFTFFRDMAIHMNFMSKRRWDAYRDIGVGTLFEGSKIFGNFVGLFQSRNGYLYTWSDEQEEAVASELKALDIVMEKTPFRLTDQFIPGHFGHTAIWTGGEEELKELGVWDELPRLYKRAVDKFNYKGAPFQEAVRNKRRLIEALRPGVQFNTFRHFLDVDDLAVLRMRDCREGEESGKSIIPRSLLEKFEDIKCLTPEIKKEYLIKAFEQVGKDYDFAFNVNTEDTIVCSELIYRTYLDLNFETSLTVGQYNISPDQVARKGDDPEDPLSPILIYHQGQKVEETGEDLRSFMKNLMFPSL